MDLTAQLARQKASAARNAENRARIAAAFGKFTSVGQGTTDFDDPVIFGITFIEEPWVSTGHRIDADGLQDALDLGDSDVLPWPIVNTFVTEWIQDANEFFIGAHVSAGVHFPTDSDPAVAPDVAVGLVHYLRFEGIAMKDVIG